MGKSQLVTEFVYRHFPVDYGLVVWVNAETSDTLVADYRQLLADLASDNADAKIQVVDINKSSDDVVSEVKSRLFRCSLVSRMPYCFREIIHPHFISNVMARFVLLAMVASYG